MTFFQTWYLNYLNAQNILPGEGSFFPSLVMFVMAVLDIVLLIVIIAGAAVATFFVIKFLINKVLGIKYNFEKRKNWRQMRRQVDRLVRKPKRNRGF